MRNLLLTAALIAVPVGVFAAGYSLLVPPVRQTGAAAAPAVSAPLGDMAAFTGIAADVRTTAKTDLAAAARRITDLETEWDKAETSLRPRDPLAWGNVDAALDAALASLRAGTPDPAQVQVTLAALEAALADPLRGAQPPVAAALVRGVAVTGPDGRPLPCETMLEQFRNTRAAATLSDPERTQIDLLQTRGTERCNADDDARADDFFAQGIALMSD